MKLQTFDSLFNFHATKSQPQHQKCTKLLQEHKVYDYVIYVCRNSVRHTSEFKDLLKELKQSLKQPKSAIIINDKIIVL